jgi:hypothetical protein
MTNELGEPRAGTWQRIAVPCPNCGQPLGWRGAAPMGASVAAWCQPCANSVRLVWLERDGLVELAIGWDCP